jgi:hypothetical protein
MWCYPRVEEYVSHEPIDQTIVYDTDEDRTIGKKPYVTVTRKDGNRIKIQQGDHLKLVFPDKFGVLNQYYNILVTSVLFDHVTEFVKLKVTLQAVGPDGANGKAHENLDIWSVYKLEDMHRPDQEIVWTNLFWNTAAIGSWHSAVHASSHPEKLSIKEPLAEFKFKVRGTALFITNSHGVTIEIHPSTKFKTLTTTSDGEIASVPGKFLSIKDDYALIEVGNKSMFKTLPQEKVNYVADLEFWKNLEIINSEFTFSDHGTFEYKGPSKLILNSDNRQYTIHKDMTFKTEIFTEKNAFQKFFKGHRSNINFKKRNGNANIIVGRFVSFTDNHAIISIDFDKTETLLLGTAALAVTYKLVVISGAYSAIGLIAKASSDAFVALGSSVGATIFGQGGLILKGLGVVQSNANTIGKGIVGVAAAAGVYKSGVVPKVYRNVFPWQEERDDDEKSGGANYLGIYTHTYEVPLDNSLPFWKKMVIETSYSVAGNKSTASGHSKTSRRTKEPAVYAAPVSSHDRGSTMAPVSSHDRGSTMAPVSVSDEEMENFFKRTSTSRRNSS